MPLVLRWLLTAGVSVLLVAADGPHSDHGLKPVFFNVASKANVTATSTCGEGKKPTIWCPFTFTGNDLGFGCDECDAKKPDKRHPISFAVDGHKTWWQSEIFPGEVNVTVDLRQQFHVASVVLKIGPSLPPRNWILEKSEDGVTFTAWQYFAGTMFECMDIFGKGIRNKPKFIEDVICVTNSSKLQNMDFGEITINLLQSRPDAGNFAFSERLQKWTKASHVRLRFLQPHTLQGHHFLSTHHDDSFKRLIFYSLRDITILARCICHGHSNMCYWNTAINRFECRCLHNTCGEECEKCCDGFVQFPWKPGHQNVNFTCEPCNCFGHSHDCIYNQTVGMKNLSLDTAGRRRGGGVCLNCQNNTFGINCEKCALGYFRPKKSPLTSACEDCGCHPQGVKIRGCDSNGQCSCQPKIQGKKCNRCLPSHWRFPHCTPCQCSPIGSRSTICHEKTGQCNCKKNVIGKNCDHCYKSLILTEKGCLDCDNCSLTLRHEARLLDKTAEVWMRKVRVLSKTPTLLLQWNFLKHFEQQVKEIQERLKHHSLGDVEIIVNSDVSIPVDGLLHSAVATLENLVRSDLKGAETAIRVSTSLANAAEHTFSVVQTRLDETILFQIWDEIKDLVDGILKMTFEFKSHSKPKARQQKSIRDGEKLLSKIKMADFSIQKSDVEQEMIAAEELYRVFNGTCHRISSNLYSCTPENYRSRIQQLSKLATELRVLSGNIFRNLTKIRTLTRGNKASINLIKGRVRDHTHYESQVQLVKHLVSRSADFLKPNQQEWLATKRYKKPLHENISKLKDILRFLKNLPSKLEASKMNSEKLSSQFIRLVEKLDSTLRRIKKFINTTADQYIKEANETALEVLEAVQYWSFNASKTVTRSKALQELARFLLKLTQRVTGVHSKPTHVAGNRTKFDGIDGSGEDLEGSASFPPELASGEGPIENNIYIDEQRDGPLHFSEKPFHKPLDSPPLENTNKFTLETEIQNDMGDFWMEEDPQPQSAIDHLRDMITNAREVNYAYLEAGRKCQTLAQNISTNLKNSTKISSDIQSSLQIKNELANTIKSFRLDHIKASPEYDVVKRNAWPTLKESFVRTNERVHELRNKSHSITLDICRNYKNCSLTLYQQAKSKTDEFIRLAAKCKKSSVHLSVSRPYATLFDQVNKKIASLREKIALAKKIARTIKGPIKFVSPGFTSPSVPEELTRSSVINRIELTIRSEYEDGLIFATSNDTKAFQVFVTLSQSRLDVCATLHGERQCTVLSTAIPLMKWIHLSMLRVGNELSLFLSAEGIVSSQGRFVWSSTASMLVPLSFPVYVGGIPEEIKATKQNDFDGCLAMTLNDQTVSLMASDIQRGIQEFCADSSTRSYNKETVVSFDGKGYHKMLPDVMLTPVKLSFKFRTFEDGSLLLHTQGIKKTDYLTVWLEEGNVLVVYRERSATMQLSTQRRNYHDGKWHEVQIKQEENTWSLSVDNTDRDSSIFLYFVVQRHVHTLLLAGLDFYTQQLLPSWIRDLKNFTGCLSNITVQENILNVQEFDSSRASLIGACHMPNSKCACLSTEQFSVQPLPRFMVNFVSFSFMTSARSSSLMMYKTSMHSSIHVFHENGRVNVRVKSRYISGRYFDREDKIIVNDGRWHTLLLLRNHSHSSTLIVDEFRIDFKDRLKETIYESQHLMYLGGLTSSKTGRLCFKDVVLNNRLLDLATKRHLPCSGPLNNISNPAESSKNK